MEVRTSPMELVSPSAIPIKAMHPPANSPTINEQSHLPQNLVRVRKTIITLNLSGLTEF